MFQIDNAIYNVSFIKKHQEKLNKNFSMKYSFQRKSKGSPLIEYEILGNNDTKLAYNQSMDIKVDIKYS